MENCCKNCKHRLGDKGREREIILQGKYPIKIFSNCEKFKEMAEFGFDPSPTCGVSIAFEETFCCQHFELSGKAEQVPTSVTEPVDFSEPKPSPYEKDEEEPAPEPEIEAEPEPAPMPEPNEGYDDGDIPF